jgi:hypothetical protein
MTVKKFLPIALFVGIQASLIQVVDQLLAPVVYVLPNNGFGWIAFQAWAMYFLAGADIKGAIKSLGGYLVGIVASIAIMVVGGSLGAHGLGFWAMPVTLLILVPIVINLELGPWMINYTPAFFIGAGVFFGFMSYISGATFSTAAITEIIYCVLGLVFGFCTLRFRVWYEKSYVNGIEKNG